MLEGNILKMKTKLREGVANYQLPIGEELLPMNELVGKGLKLEFDGVINCIATGEQVKKTYGDGYSYKAFMTLARCDVCIVKPELCHYAQGTCREPKWGEENCFQPHVIYLANSSNLKVGITRQSQIPTRWIDQGAVEALPILRVPDRYTSGLIEVEIAKEVADKTNWRNMLKNEIQEIDLYQHRERIFDLFADLLDDFDAEDLDEDIVRIEYPVLEYPQKVKSMTLDKRPTIDGKLMGIKGQYLIFDSGVINIRRHQGYKIKVSC